MEKIVSSVRNNYEIYYPIPNPVNVYPVFHHGQLLMLVESLSVLLDVS